MSAWYVVAFAVLWLVSTIMAMLSARDCRPVLAAKFGMVAGACLALTVYGLSKP